MKRRSRFTPWPFLWLMLLFCNALPAQSNVTAEWIRTFQSLVNDWDEGKEVAQDGSGNTYLLGEVNKGQFDGAEVRLEKYDPSGSLLWSQQYHNAYGRSDEAVDVKTDSSGNVYILANTYFGSLYMQDMMVRKYDPNGTELWTTYYDGAFNMEEGKVLHISPGGEVTVAGITILANGDYEHFVVRMNQGGIIQYGVQLPISSTSGYWNGVDLEVDAAGNSYVIGSPNLEYAGGLAGDCRFFKLTNNGVVEWDTTLITNQSGLYYGIEIDLDINQEPVLFLYSDGGNQAFEVKGFDANGHLRGETLLIPPSAIYGKPHSMVIGQDEYIYITYYQNVNPADRVQLVKIAPDFQIVWDRTLASDFDNPPGVHNSLFQLPNGNLVLTGMTDFSSSLGAFEDDLLVLEYDTAANLVQRIDWEGGFDGKDEFSEAVIDDNGRVFIAGQSMGGLPNRDMALVKLDLSGGSDWVRRYNTERPGKATLMEIGTDSSGNIYAGGQLEGQDHLDNIQLVKYDVSGNLIWDKEISLDSIHAIVLGDMLVDGQGNITLAFAGNYVALPEFYVRRLDSNGDFVWDYAFAPPLGIGFTAKDLAVDDLGNIYGGADFKIGNTNFVWYLNKLTPTGNLLWEQQISTGLGPVGVPDLKKILPIGADVWAVGRKGSQVAGAKLDPSGNQIANLSPSSVPNSITVADAAISAGGDPVLLTRVPDTTNSPVVIGWNWNLMRYDPIGNLAWESRLAGNPQEFSVPTALRVSSNGSIYAGGITGFSDNTLARFSPNGNLDWRYSGASNAIQSNVGVGDIMHFNDGGAALTGKDGQTTNQAIVNRLDNQGNSVWTYTYTSPSQYFTAEGKQLVSGPGGELYAGIEGVATDIHREFVLIKFGQATSLPDPTPSDVSLLYPQPAHDHLKVQWEGLRYSQEAKIALIDMQGRFIHRSTVTKATPHSTLINIDLPMVTPGIYLIQIENEQGESTRDKILVN